MLNDVDASTLFHPDRFAIAFIIVFFYKSKFRILCLWLFRYPHQTWNITHTFWCMCVSTIKRSSWMILRLKVFKRQYYGYRCLENSDICLFVCFLLLHRYQQTMVISRRSVHNIWLNTRLIKLAFSFCKRLTATFYESATERDWEPCVLSSSQGCLPLMVGDIYLIIELLVLRSTDWAKRRLF